MRLRIKLHRPQEIIWLVSLVLAVVGLLAFIGPLAGVRLGLDPFWFETIAAILMILGTWLF